MTLRNFGVSDQMEEELQIEHRYLTLRTTELQARLRFRSKLFTRMRNWMANNEFIDVETPTLIRRTPGGAREFPVATKHKGQFYSLAQSPQILKQLLMVGGMDRYYQIARCYRDEKSKGDRQPEFTQLDIECSFTTRENIMALVEDMLKSVLNVEDIEKFPIITYEEAMAKYNTDKPDVNGFIWVVDFPLFTKCDDGSFESAHHPFTQPKDEDYVYSCPEKVAKLIFEII